MRTKSIIKTMKTVCGKELSYLETTGEPNKMHSTEGPAITYAASENKAPEYIFKGSYEANIQGGRLVKMSDGKMKPIVARLIIQLFYNASRVVNFFTHLGNAAYGVLHHLLAFVSRMVRLIRRLGGRCGILRDILRRRRHLVHRGSHHIGAGELILGALGHQP